MIPNTHRFGFNGMEKDDEVSGNGNSYTTFYRQNDPRLGRWLSVDPKAKLMAWQSPFTSMDNNPISKMDPKGDCPMCVGAAVGAGIDILLQSAEIALDDSKTFKDDFTFTSVFISAAAGATGAGLATKVSKLGKVTQLAVEVTMDATSSAVHQKATTGEVDLLDVAIDVIAGRTLGKKAGDFAENIVEHR